MPNATLYLVPNILNLALNQIKSASPSSENPKIADPNLVSPPGMDRATSERPLWTIVDNPFEAAHTRL
jgi:hypothetical protein